MRNALDSAHWAETIPILHSWWWGWTATAAQWIPLGFNLANPSGDRAQALNGTSCEEDTAGVSPAEFLPYHCHLTTEASRALPTLLLIEYELHHSKVRISGCRGSSRYGPGVQFDSKGMYLASVPGRDESRTPRAPSRWRLPPFTSGSSQESHSDLKLNRGH